MAEKARKKTSRRTTLTRKSIRQKQSSSWLNIFRFGESYSSLLLGILVVIITTVLLVFLVRDRNSIQNNPSQRISSTNTELTNTTDEEKLSFASASAGVTKVPTILTPTAKPTLSPTLQPTLKPSIVITKIPTLKPSVTLMQPTIVAQTTPAVSVIDKDAKSHTVVAGENLWSIAERYYKSGYNWTDIARVNNLSNPGMIRTGMKLTIPSVTPKTATVKTAPAGTEFGPVIIGTTYKVEKGDHLWGIAVRAFSDGYKWVEIARVNNIKVPNTIQPGEVLKIPRTAPPVQK